MKILITGSSGQLGRALMLSAPNEVEAIAADRNIMDFSDCSSLAATARDIRPDVVINAAAYTAVDKAESEQALASTINAEAPAILAEAVQETGGRMIQVSTDFVFSGARTGPWQTNDQPKPINHYGASKLAGEIAVKRILANRSSIVRTAWVYAPWGQNFVLSMLRLMSERDQLNIVADQIGTPTSATGLAAFLWQLVANEESGGTWHWTDAGVASWYDFAVAVQELGLEKGLLQKPCSISPITTSEFPTPAKRPDFSVLDKATTWKQFDCNPTHWRAALDAALSSIAEE